METVLHGGLFVRLLLILVLAGAAAAAESGLLVDRVGATAFVQLEAESFQKLSPRQQALAYWLSQASIAIDPIILVDGAGEAQLRVMARVVGLGTMASGFSAAAGNGADRARA